jgi:chromosome segregation ATPase
MGVSMCVRARVCAPPVVRCQSAMSLTTRQVVQAEVNRLKRELMNEREQVVSLTFSHKQAASAQQRAEEELERLKHRSAQELVQVQANKGELWQTLMQTRNESAKETDQLREQLVKLTERADAAESRRDVLESEKALWTADTSVSTQRVRCRGD